MIKEYRSYPEVSFVGGAHLDWHGRRSIDLRCVSSAAPCDAGEGAQATTITVAGIANSFAIDVPYESFIRDWQSVKRQP